MVAFEDLALWSNAAIFVGGALVVWLAGTRLTRYAEAVAERTRFGHALIGALLLGGVTSLPELATTSTAVLGGNAPLAVNNILGGVTMQVAILGAVDATMRKNALSSAAGSASLLLQGNGLMLALALAAAGITSGSIVVLGVDLWTVMLAVVVIVVIASIQRYEDAPSWQPAEDTIEARHESHRVPDSSGSGVGRLAAYTAGTGVVVIIAGYVVTRAADAAAVQTGLGASFVGAVFLAVATSLPEVSTTLEAVRRGHARLAFSNIFGTNLLDVGFLFIADVLYRGGSVLQEVGDFSVFASLLGMVLTGVFVAGILQRRKPAILRVGVDSAVVLALYLGGTVILYSLR